MKGDSNWMRGRKHTFEIIDKISSIKIKQYENGEVKISKYFISNAEVEIAKYLDSINIVIN